MDKKDLIMAHGSRIKCADPGSFVRGGPTLTFFFV